MVVREINMGQPRNKLVSIRLTDGEFRLLHEACDRDGGISVSEFFRSHALPLLWRNQVPQGPIHSVLDKVERTITLVESTVRDVAQALRRDGSMKPVDDKTEGASDVIHTSLTKIAGCQDDTKAIRQLKSLLCATLSLCPESNDHCMSLDEQLGRHQAALNNIFAVRHSMQIVVRHESSVSKADLVRARYWLDRAVREIAGKLTPELRNRIRGD